jgi:hypothetical protein
MSDKIEKIYKLLDILDANCVPEHRENNDDCIKAIKALLCGCLDNNNVLVLYDREQLDDWKNQFTDEPATDEEWNNFRNHKDVDYAYEHASEYLNGAESSVIDEDKYSD